MKFKRATAFLLTIILALSAMSAGALAVVEPTEDFYVADYANVLSDETEQLIINYNGALEQQCDGAQAVVVTVEYLDGMYADEYATALFNEWGIGSSSSDNGVLLLLAVEENKFWMVQGLGIASAPTTDDINSILDNYLAQPFDAGDYDTAVTDAFMQILAWYDGYYSANVIASNPEYQQAYEQQSSASRSSGVMSSIITVVIVLVFISMFTSRSRYRRTGGGGFFFPFWMGSMFGRGMRHRPHHDHWDDDDHFGGWGGGMGHGGGGLGGSGGLGGGGGCGGGGFSSGGGGGRR